MSEQGINSLQMVSVPYDDLPLWFHDERQVPPKAWYKIYNDGGHYVATLCRRGTYFPSKENNRKRTEKDALFDNLYANSQVAGLKNEELFDHIKCGILKLFPEEQELEGYIVNKIQRKGKNLYDRKKRFRRKAFLYPWNYFTTITYDDNKHDQDSFRVKLRRTLSNFHTRRDWLYMGVFECAPDSGRLHFHGLLYVPDGQMVGDLTVCQDYDTRAGKMQTTASNSFFEKSFGRNDFRDLNVTELRRGNTIKYLLKYIGKSNERVVYSRGIQSSICMEVERNDFVSEMQDTVMKYILFDDVIDWTRDVAGKRFGKQITMVDLMCNPPQK